MPASMSYLNLLGPCAGHRAGGRRTRYRLRKDLKEAVIRDTSGFRLEIPRLIKRLATHPRHHRDQRTLMSTSVFFPASSATQTQIPEAMVSTITRSVHSIVCLSPQLSGIPAFAADHRMITDPISGCSLNSVLFCMVKRTTTQVLSPMIIQ